MLDTVAQAVVEALTGAGINAKKQYPLSWLDRGEGPVVCVGIKSAELSASGAGNYLGTKTDSDGNTRELYGVKAETVISMDIYSPAENGDGQAECLGCFRDMSAALAALPGGVRVNTLVCGQVKPDGVTEMMQCPCQAHCTVFLIGETAEDSTEFLDFTLKGVLKHGDR